LHVIVKERLDRGNFGRKWSKSEGAARR